jgi:hypothetical protein
MRSNKPFPFFGDKGEGFKRPAFPSLPKVRQHPRKETFDLISFSAVPNTHWPSFRLEVSDVSKARHFPKSCQNVEV